MTVTGTDAIITPIYSFRSCDMINSFSMLKNEKWWGGSTHIGPDEPFGEETCFSFDYRGNCPNQTMPLFLSSAGRYIWSELPFKITIKNGIIETEGEAEAVIAEAGSSLRDAYLAAMKAHFPFEDKPLPEIFFRTAQYNTWMQFTYDPTEEGVLKYARDIIANGFEPGIFIIDEGWHGRYGLWQFDRLKFPHPKEMTEELHRLGFKVMLWVVPYVTPDGKEFELSRWPDMNPHCNEQYLRNAKGEIVLVSWWNGISALLDMTKEADREFLDKKLRFLMDEYGIDGFKFDGGAVDTYAPEALMNGPAQTEHTPEELNLAWNEFGSHYEYHEYKDTYRGGGKAVIERLQDRSHTWDRDGILSLIPSAIVQGLLGSPYVCPDMIGGGSWVYRDFYADRFDPELFVRMAQCSALFPMMQFSWAPWDDLGDDDLALVRDAAKLHKSMADEIVSLVSDARRNGEPIVRSLEYADPGKGFESVSDEFLLGNDILVAPVLTKGAAVRTVVFPEGKWVSQTDGKTYSGKAEVDAPRSVLPWFRRAE